MNDFYIKTKSGLITKMGHTLCYQVAKEDKFLVLIFYSNEEYCVLSAFDTAAEAKGLIDWIWQQVSYYHKTYVDLDDFVRGGVKYEPPAVSD
mgnify:CR=1 FL=1